MIQKTSKKHLLNTYFLINEGTKKQMTETQLNLLRKWFREEVEYLIKENIQPKRTYYYSDEDLPDYYADKAFNDVVIAFCKEDN